MKTRYIPAAILISLVMILGSSLNMHAQNLDQESAPDGQNLPPDSIVTGDPETPYDISSLEISESRALGLSLFMTLIPTASLVMAGPGLLFGPSIGYFYAGMPMRALKGICIRIVGLGGMCVAYFVSPSDGGYHFAVAGFCSGIALTVGSAIHDIASIKKNVRKKNNAMTSVLDTFTPTYFAESNAFGLKIKLTL